MQIVKIRARYRMDDELSKYEKAKKNTSEFSKLISSGCLWNQ